MCKALVIPFLAIFAGHQQIETKLDLFVGDAQIGSGTYTERTDHNGHRTSEIVLYSKDESSSQKRKITLVKVIDKHAFPIREEEHITVEIKRKRYEIIRKVRYDDSGAAIFSERSGNTAYADRTYMPIPGYSRSDASDLWFSKTKPLPGTTVSSTSFDIESAKWQVVETTYIGRRWITVGGRQVEANEVRDIRDDNVRHVYLDDKGQPLLMKNGNMRTEKHF